MGPEGAHPRTGVPEVILASGSPRRRELLGLLGVPFRVRVSGEPENSATAQPDALAGELALVKARAVAAAEPGAVVIGSDTVVALDGTLLGKPADAAENAAFLRTLAGRTHQVYTGVGVVHGAHEHVEVSRADVTFRDLTPGEIAHYAASGEGLDKAGGYGIQALGMALVLRIEGEYSTVVGFPLSVVIRLLRAAGVPVWNEPHAPELRPA
ncbi:septum formation protein [Deinococcus metalli]|uniref:dTTP/UTP pyrophosphatase n=1 Tax=Deinococcus metalli TaxID=1141878 RepID=A0A7W8NQL0_9DEIO|nr:Maf family nucleotide pyrophosphatase [Deinococcus metalli]MBB5375232.1 septum formation protein [Deinococcus metalli]GHF30792.1 Maf-like protein [Deinococcus metalli]